MDESPTSENRAVGRGSGYAGPPGRFLRWALVVSFGVLVACCTGLALLFGLLSASPLAALGALGAAAILLPVYVLYLLVLDPLEHEPPWLLVGAFLWGAGVATLGGGLTTLVAQWASRTFFNLSASGGDVVGTAIFAPIFEEGFKGLGVLLLFALARHEFDDAVDGILYGGLIGLGFAFVEDFLYYAVAIQEGGFASLLSLFVIRGILSGFGHPLYTALVGLGFGLARQSPFGWRWMVLPGLGYAAAVAAHSAWNAPIALATVFPGLEVLGILTVFAYPFLVLLPGAIGLGILAFVIARRRARMVRAALEEACELGLADAEDARLLGRPVQRRWRQLRYLERYGWRAFWLRRRLDIALIDWAYRHWHRSRGDQLPRFLAVFEEDALAARIRSWRQELAHLLTRSAA